MKLPPGYAIQNLTPKRRILVANRAEAIFYRENEHGKLEFISRLRHPAGRRTETELVSDRPGVTRSSGGGGTIHHGLGRDGVHHEETAKRFAGRIGRLLSAELRQSPYDELVVAAEPHFLGLLRGELSAEVKKKVKTEIPREYAQGSDQEIGKLIRRAAGP